MFDSLTEKIQGAIEKLSRVHRLDEPVLDEITRKLRNALLEADVHINVANDFSQTIRKKLSEKEIPWGSTADGHVLRTIYESLIDILGKKTEDLHFRDKPPHTILLVGLQGGGKTTTAVKLAYHLKASHKKKVLVTSLDMTRAGAILQLEIQASQAGVATYNPIDETSVTGRVILAKEEALKSAVDVLIVDTAGRVQVDEELMEEVEEVRQIISPSEVLLVLDSMLGQIAVDIALKFQERLALTGFILTKLDGDAKGGACLSVRAVTGCPIKFMGVGEKFSDLEIFHPDRIASRILDLGDLVTLSEKVSEVQTESDSKALLKKIKKNQFTFVEFLDQLAQIRKIGSLETMIRFIPGMSQLKKQLQGAALPSEKDLKKIEAIILSMTKEERMDYHLLNGRRKLRIAKGSGTKVEDINKLIKNFLETKKMFSRYTKHM